MSRTDRWLIYGAYGFSGELIAREALRRGHRPILAGRSADKLKPLANELGLESIAVDLDDSAALARALDGIDLVFHAAGPFVDTSEAMVRACLVAGANYVDITGEIPVFQHTFANDAAAKQKGIALMSGVGFDVVPTDCLARFVADRTPGATELEIAFAVIGRPSTGTAKSSFSGFLRGGLVRRDGKLVSLPMGKGGRKVRFSEGVRTVVPIPWGDLETAYWTTGIPNITTYLAFPPKLAAALAATWPLQAAAQPLLRAVLGLAPIKGAILRSIEKRVSSPDQVARSAGRSLIWARAADAQGHACEAWLETIDGYDFTAIAGVRAIERILKERPIGALTPAGSFGADFVLELEGTRRYEQLPAEPETARPLAEAR